MINSCFGPLTMTLLYFYSFTHIIDNPVLMPALQATMYLHLHSLWGKLRIIFKTMKMKCRNSSSIIMNGEWMPMHFIFFLYSSSRSQSLATFTYAFATSFLPSAHVSSQRSPWGQNVFINDWHHISMYELILTIYLLKGTIWCFKISHLSQAIFKNI